MKVYKKKALLAFAKTMESLLDRDLIYLDSITIRCYNHWEDDHIDFSCETYGDFISTFWEEYDKLEREEQK